MSFSQYKSLLPIDPPCKICKKPAEDHSSMGWCPGETTNYEPEEADAADASSNA